MTSLLARCRIGCQIAVLGLVGLLGMGLVAGIGQLAMRDADRSDTALAFARDALDLEAELQIQFLEARRQEKNFLMRRDEASFRLHAAAMTAIGQRLSALRAQLAAEPATLATLSQIETDIGRYGTAFAQLVQQAREVGLTEEQGLQGALRGSVRAVEQALATVEAPRAQIAMLMMRRHEKDFIARLDPKYGAELRARLPEFTAALAAAEVADAQRAQVGADMAAYQERFGRFAAGMLGQKALEGTLVAVHAEIGPRLAQLHAAFVARAKTARAEGLAVTAAAERTVLWSLGGILAVVALLSWVVGRGIARPIIAMTRAMEALVRGELDVVIPDDGRRDEIGTMVAALRAFKDSLAQSARLREQQVAARESSEADKRAALAGMADRIEAEAAAAVQAFGGRTGAVAATADEMRALVARTGRSAQDAAGAAATALANAQAVASAAEELSASIQEISGQVSRSTQIVGQTVEASESTRAAIGTLSEMVGRIGVVADIISDIAARTNLLALNATIEAARAGEAGKGFAVVASEVKQLANQTATSTQEINRHIADVRAATAAAVDAVGRIGATIQSVNEISGSVAAAVAQQGAATAEIARNVTETAAAVNEMSAQNDAVSREAEQGGRYAAEVLDNTRALEGAIEDMRQAIIRTIRTSTAEADRRLSTRHQVDLPCRIEPAGHGAQTARLVDVSAGGAQVAGGPALAAGTRGMLRLEGLALPLAFETLGGGDGAVHLAFRAEEDAHQALLAWLQRLGEEAAA